jgi:hypothetical protein
MLSGLSEIVADCYRRAAECQELARLATNEKDREFYLAREHDWLVLARSHQTAETGHKILDELDRRRGVFKTQSCPACKGVTPIHYDELFVCVSCRQVFE